MKVGSRKLSRIFLFIIIGIIVPLIHACAQGMFTTQDNQSKQDPSANFRQTTSQLKLSSRSLEDRNRRMPAMHALYRRADVCTHFFLIAVFATGRAINIIRLRIRLKISVSRRRRLRVSNLHEKAGAILAIRRCGLRAGAPGVYRSQCLKYYDDRHAHTVFMVIASERLRERQLFVMSTCVMAHGIFANLNNTRERAHPCVRNLALRPIKPQLNQPTTART